MDQFCFRWAQGQVLEFLLGIYVCIITRSQMSRLLQLIATAIAVFLHLEAGSIRLPGIVIIALQRQLFASDRYL
jgi:hypothetical protein